MTGETRVDAGEWHACQIIALMKKSHRNMALFEYKRIKWIK